MTARSTLLALTALCAFGAPATFEVASVKPRKAPRVPGIGGNVTMTNWSPTMLISAAWDLEPGQRSGGPDWLGTDRYDIVAKTSPGATQADLRIMLQALLAERFKLVTHRETKDLPLYALVAPKGAAKLQPATGDQRGPVIFMPPARLDGHGSTIQVLALALTRPALDLYRAPGPTRSETGTAERTDGSSGHRPRGTRPDRQLDL